ncbi:MAG: cadmium resistance transporter [Alkalibacterium sp.]|nr:cadmium resistance transporter [Alkalibacterium sp.]
MSVLFTALVSYIGTSIDYIIVLILLFAHIRKNSKGIMAIVLGQYVGLGILLGISILAAYGLGFIREDWVGFLGLVPIFLGLKVAFEKEEEGEAEEAVESSFVKHKNVFWSVVFLMLALGGDNLGVYIPLFAAFSLSELVLTIGVYFVLSAGLLFGTYKIAEVNKVSNWVEKYERVLVPLVFVGIGLYIMWESGTFLFLANLL